MSFTYFHDPAAPVERDYVRFHLNDVIKDSGPLPENYNFSDHELDMLLDLEGTWQRAVAAGFEALEAAWLPHPTFQADGMSVSLSHISKNYGDTAQRWRRIYGGQPGSSIKARSLIRVDGYSQDVASDEVS
jgi:hypothetical protein